ncbi:MAG TPA: GIY-YIG nuclease family protein [Allocoleopsis sp.]
MSGRFDPEICQWIVTHYDWGMGGTLQDCLEVLFSSTDDSGPPQLALDLHKEFKSSCLKNGYASADGWTVYYATIKGESSLDRNESKPKPGYVYVIHAVGTDRYKIGKSVNPNARLTSLSKQAPYRLKLFLSFHVQDMSGAEKQLHRYFVDKQVNSEWFQLDDRDIEYLKAWSNNSV